MATSFATFMRTGASAPAAGSRLTRGSWGLRALWAVVGLALAAAPAHGQEEDRFRWQRLLYGTFAGQPALLYSDSAFHGKLAFGDLDGDGDADLLVGKMDGGINRYENVGSPAAPEWRLVEENVSAIVPVRGQEGLVKRFFTRITAGAHAAPTLVDIDHDGDLDLLVGTADGRLLFYRNQGTQVLFAFELAAERFIAPVLGTRLVPFFVDVDRNLSPDLFLGNAEGQVLLLINQGNKKVPRFCAAREAGEGAGPPCTPNVKHIASITPETHAVPALVDWDGDGDQDLFIGKRNGTITYFENRGTADRAEWHISQSRFLAIDNGGYAAPAFIDANGDGRPDLLAGTNSNNVFLYTNKDTGKLLDVWRVTGNLLRVERIGLNGERVAIASGDLDGDGDMDLVTGDHAGTLHVVVNEGTKQEPAWRVLRGPILADTGRANVAPFLVDIDADGDLDLVVGGEDGKLWLILNVGTTQRPVWRLGDTAFGGVDVGSNAVPALGDLDKDGDPDLLVGNSRGLVIYFRNEGTPQAANFRLVTTRFGGISVGKSAAPALYDWNQDKRPDLVIGNREGTLVLTINENQDDASFRTWQLKSRAWRNIQVKGYSMPHFQDVNGDGLADLLIGDAEGNVQLWANGGALEEGRAQAVAAQVRSGAGSSPAGGPSSAPLNLASLGGAPAGGPQSEQTAQLAALLQQEVAVGPLPPVYVAASTALGGLNFDGRAVPLFEDLDGDGDPDMLIGTRTGELIYFRNDGPKDNPKWVKVTDRFAGFDHGRNAAPAFGDVDGDGETDLVVGTEAGRVVFFKGSSEAGERTFTYVEGALRSVNVGRNASPALTRLGLDKEPLLLVGEFSGKIVAYTRIEGSDPPDFKRTHRQFLGLDVGVSATPFMGDMDRDGVLDLLVGSDQGNVLNFEKIPPTVKNPWGWRPGPPYLKSLKFPLGTTPRLADLEGDGDQDMFLGTEKGDIYYFRNDANPASVGQ